MNKPDDTTFQIVQKFATTSHNLKTRLDRMATKVVPRESSGVDTDDCKKDVTCLYEFSTSLQTVVQGNFAKNAKKGDAGDQPTPPTDEAQAIDAGKLLAHKVKAQNLLDGLLRLGDKHDFPPPPDMSISLASLFDQTDAHHLQCIDALLEPLNASLLVYEDLYPAAHTVSALTINAQTGIMVEHEVPPALATPLLALPTFL